MRRFLCILKPLQESTPPTPSTSSEPLPRSSSNLNSEGDVSSILEQLRSASER